MFSAMGSAMSAAALRAECAQAQEKCFRLYVDSLPVEARQKAIDDHRAMQEKLRLEAIEERRHQELLRAIRDRRDSSGPPVLAFGLGWLFGQSY